jgi:selenocysteine lyase/cysteine desulfurase
MKHFAIAATARASFYLYNIDEDLDRRVDALGVVGGILRYGTLC